MDEVVPQVTEMKKPVCEPSPWSLEEELREYIRAKRDGILRVAREKVELRQMRWPDVKSDGVALNKGMSEQEMFPVGSERNAVKPVLVVAKSEVFTPVVFFWGGGRCCGSSPGRGGGSHSASFCPISGWCSNRSTG